MNAVSRYWSSGIVSNTASAMNASVPSEPTTTRRRISTGVVAIEKRLHVVAGGVLDAEFFGGSIDQRRIGLDLALDLHQSAGECRLFGGEMRIGIGCCGVDQRSGGQHDRERRQRLVGVLGRPAAHAARIVGDDAADRAGAGACGVGSESTAGRRQREIGAVEDRAGPGAQPPPAILDRDAGPIAAHVDQDAVALGLAAQARARGAEGDGFMPLPRVSEDLAHVVDAAGDHDGLGKQAVRACVGREADEVDCARQHALGTDQGAEVRGERFGGAAREPVGGTVALRRVGLGRQCADVRGEEPAHGRLPVVRGWAVSRRASASVPAAFTARGPLW